MLECAISLDLCAGADRPWRSEKGLAQEEFQEVIGEKESECGSFVSISSCLMGSNIATQKKRFFLSLACM